MKFMEDGASLSDSEQSSSESPFFEKKQYITNQYSSINEPLDVIMGGSSAMLNIISTLVNSLARLDGAVEVIFNRLDTLDESVATLTYNIQGFEVHFLRHIYKHIFTSQVCCLFENNKFLLKKTQ
jgi:hypothetical protein